MPNSEYYQNLIAEKKLTMKKIHEMIMDDEEMNGEQCKYLLSFCMGIISQYRKQV